MRFALATFDHKCCRLIYNILDSTHYTKYFLGKGEGDLGNLT